MSLRDVISKIKTMLSESEIKLTDVKTMDGVILNYEGDLAVGIEIFLVDETGKNPCPDGEYILEDGTKIEVVGGLVESVEMPEAPIEEDPEEMPVAEMPMSGTTMSELDLVEEPVSESLSLEDLAKKVKCLEDENLQMKEILAQLAESFSQKNFQEEVKMSMVKEVEKPVERPVLKNQKTNELNNIFKNMYK